MFKIKFLRNRAFVCLLAFFMSGVAFASEPQEEARKVIEQYYKNVGASDYKKAMELFDLEAEVQVTWKYGYGYPDDSITLNGSDLDYLASEERAEEMKEMLEDYSELSRTHEIVSLKREGDKVHVNARQTVRYEVSSWQETATVNDVFLLAKQDKGLKIISLESVTEY